MTTVRLTLQPASAFGTPLLGEILFGQMCWAFVRLYGEERLADLLEGYVDGRPFAVCQTPSPAAMCLCRLCPTIFGRIRQAPI